MMGTAKSSAKDMSKATCRKCGQCIHLNGERTSIGIECTNPEKVWRTKSAKYHYSHHKACKMFFPKPLQKATCEINMRLPSANDYIDDCRTNRFKASKKKHDLEENIMFFLKDLPKFNYPVEISFHWVEENKRRDLDNIAFAKKFILDAMVKSHILSDDNRNCVTAFTDTFSYDEESKVVLTIVEVDK